MGYETLINSINKITLSKEEEKSEYIPRLIIWKSRIRANCCRKSILFK